MDDGHFIDDPLYIVNVKPDFSDIGNIKINKATGTMEKNLKVCVYPNNGFGEKNGMKYLLDQFGNRFDFSSEYDKALDERYWYLQANCKYYTGETPAEVIEKMREDGYIIKEW